MQLCKQVTFRDSAQNTNRRPIQFIKEGTMMRDTQQPIDIYRVAALFGVATLTQRSLKADGQTGEPSPASSVRLY